MERNPSASAGTAQRLCTALLIVGPLLAVAVSVPLLWGHALHWRDVALGVVLYLVTGHGITVGFHRMFTHASFRPNRPLKLVLGIAGSMAVQGSVVSWVANHRRHHVHSDQPGDPHTPHDPTVAAGRRFLHAHVGWLFRPDTTSVARFAPDLLKDRDAVMLSRLFPLLAAVSLVIPFLAGWALSGQLRGALTAFVWAGLVRMALLHHVTWSINSICHVTGRRPFPTTDRSGNVAALALVSMGESWHNLHHAAPSLARHGVERGQIDSSARLIGVFERLGWATKVRWPTPQRVAGIRG
jgi:stearoyl-CoA desaturase (Delta-9 desaturase)